MDAAFITLHRYRHRDHVQPKAFYTLCRLYTLYHHNKEHLNVKCIFFNLPAMNDLKFLQKGYGILVQMWCTDVNFSEKLAHEISCCHIPVVGVYNVLVAY